MKKLILLTLLTTLSFTASAKILKIYDTQHQTEVEFNSLVANLPKQGHFILGEYHNSPSVQMAQKQIIEAIVKESKSESDFTVMWEFLNYTDQVDISTKFEKLQNNEINASEFINQTAGNQNQSYTPIIQATKDLKGNLFGINLPRALKQKVIKEGIDSINPNYIPATHYVGGDKYLARFKEAMGGHAPEEMIKKYFLAQCLTDSVMAEQIHLNHSTPLNFVIAGSFHTDFYDGTVVRLKENYNDVITFKIFSSEHHDENQTQEIFQGHTTYGNYADFIILTE